VQDINKNKDPLHKPVYISRRREDTEVEIAIQYNNTFQETIFSFANNIHTTEVAPTSQGSRRPLRE